MYLKQIILENIGPIDECNFNLPFDENGNPKPTIIVGENGTGKSILLSFIINAILSAKQLFYENTEVEKGKVYKYRSQDYIKSGNEYYFAKLVFDNDIECIEWQLSKTREEFEKYFGYCPNNGDWEKIPKSNVTSFWTNFQKKRDVLQKFIDENCLLYFPANRFEEPAWLNILNLNSKA